MVERVFQNDFTSGVLSPGLWSRTDIKKYRSGAKQIVNGIPLAHGGITKRPGTYFIEEVPAAGRLIPFKYSVVQTYVLAFFNYKMRIYKDGGVVVYPSGHELAGQVVEIVSPYALSDLPSLAYMQSADTMFLAHPSYAPRTLTRTDHHVWTFAVIAFEPTIGAPSAPAITPKDFSDDEKTIDINYKISAISEEGEESYPSVKSTTMIPKSWTGGATVEITWASVTNAVKYNVYKNKRGYYGWIGTVSSTDGLKFIDDNIEPDAGDGPKEEKNPFKDNNNPGVVGIFQQRMVFARSNSQPQTVWASQPGSLNNFSTSYPLKDDDSIEITMDSRQMNEVRALFPLKDSLLVLTSGAEWMMTPGRNSDAITPSATHIYPQSYWGCGTVSPVVAGNNLLMVQNSGKIIRDLYYTIAEDGYAGTEISILAEHLFSSPVVAWSYQHEPYHTVYAIREDGVLLTLTYMREQEVYAWASHQSDGAYLDVCSIQNGKNDTVYFLTRRNGRYLMEYQKMREYGDVIEDAFYVDCGLTYNGSATDTVSGLEHLAGKTVDVLADGSAIKNLIVASDGTVKLPRQYQKIHVGLSYSTLIETLDPEIDGANGLIKRTVRAILRFRETAGGGEVGPDKDSLVKMKFPLPDDYGNPPGLFSGDMNVALVGRHSGSASIMVKHDYPLPFTLLSQTSVIKVGG